MGLNVKVCNGGRLISRGYGRHVTRIIDTWELIFVVNSQLKMVVGDENYDVPAGNCLLLPPQLRHGGREPYTPNLSFFWIHFTPENQECRQYLEALPRMFPVQNFARLSEYFQLFLAVQAEEQRDRIAQNMIMALILHEAGKCRNEVPEEVQQTPPLVMRLEKILTLQFRDDLSVSEIARTLQCNPDYLGRLYRDCFGKSIIEALNEKRLKHAARLLQDTSLNVSEIALYVGYNDSAYFRRRFFRLYAMTPLAYRKLKKQGHLNTE